MDETISDREWITAKKVIINDFICNNPRLFNVSNRKAGISLLLLSAAMAIALTVLAYEPVLFAVPTFLVIGIVQYHFSTALHEISHFSFLKPRWLNEAVGWFLGFLLAFDLAKFRKHHTLHHKYYGSNQDPDWSDYQITKQHSSLPGLLARIALENCVYGAAVRLFHREFRETFDETTVGEIGKPLDNFFWIFPATGLVQLGLLALFHMAGAWWFYFIFWVLPLASITPYLSMIRMLGEHGELSTEAKNPRILLSRTCAWDPKNRWSWLRLFESFTTGAFNFNYHHEHHWLPNLPYHALPHLFEKLTELGHYKKFPDCYSSSTFRKIAEFTG